MWYCPGCGVGNEDGLTSCKKCHARTEDAAGEDETQLTILFDPDTPQAVSDAGKVDCPTCGQQFSVRRKDATRTLPRYDSALCPHCGHSLTPELLLRVVPAERAEDEAPVREALYACPYCGKILSVMTE